jgi:hypothetical protein
LQPCRVYAARTAASIFAISARSASVQRRSLSSAWLTIARQLLVPTIVLFHSHRRSGVLFSDQSASPEKLDRGSHIVRPALA